MIVSHVTLPEGVGGREGGNRDWEEEVKEGMKAVREGRSGQEIKKGDEEEWEEGKGDKR